MPDSSLEMPHTILDANSIPQTFVSDRSWDIVDSQLHFSREALRPALFAMDALGIRSALVDEFWDIDGNGTFRPGYRLPNGASRAVALTAAAAAHEHAARFSYVLRIDYRDSQLEDVIRNVAADPGGRGIRITVFHVKELQTAFRAGKYSAIFDAARKYELPIFVANPGNPKDLVWYATEYPDVTIVLDHIGMSVRSTEVDFAVFEDVLELGSLSNVFLKWAHAQQSFHVRDYPFDELTPFLLSVLREFGKERLMWASDISMTSSGHSWAELLFSIRENSALSLTERQWILGRTARKVLKWPQTVHGSA